MPLVSATSMFWLFWLTRYHKRDRQYETHAATDWGTRDPGIDGLINRRVSGQPPSWSLK